MAQLERVKVSNPTRAKRRRKKPPEGTMAKKKRAKSKSSTSPKKTRSKKKRRTAPAAAPPAKKTRKRSKKRRAPAAAAAPRRKARRKGGSRKGRKHTHWGKVKAHKRKTNPPAWAMAGLAAIAGLASYAVFGAGSFAATQRLDPSMATLERNRYIAGGIATALGLGVAVLASPIVGAGLAAGGLIGLVGTDLYLAIGKVIDKAPEPAPAKKISGLYQGGQQRLMQGVYGNGRQQFGHEQYLNAGRQPMGMLGINGIYSAGAHASG